MALDDVIRPAKLPRFSKGMGSWQTHHDSHSLLINAKGKWINALNSSLVLSILDLSPRGMRAEKAFGMVGRVSASCCVHESSSNPPKLDKFNDWGEGRECNIFVPVLRGDGTKIVPTGNRFDQPPGQMRWIWVKLADHVGDHVVLFPEGAVLMNSTGTKLSYPCPP